MFTITENNHGSKIFRGVEGRLNNYTQKSFGSYL